MNPANNIVEADPALDTRSATRKKVTRWVSNGGLAIFDQGMISGSNFLLSILLARWLVPEQYGAYAVAFGIFVLITIVYQALVLEPMSVFGGSSYRECLRGYLRSLMWIHLGLSVVIFVGFGTAALVAQVVTHNGVMSGALAGVTIASPFLLVFGLARRTFYLQLSPLKAAIGSLVYSVSVLGILYPMFRHGLLSVMSAFLVMGIGSALTSIYLVAYLRRDLSRSTVAPPALKESWVRHWGYGRWALASSFAGWIPAYIYYPLLSSFGNMTHSGELKALMNFTLPIEQIKGALGLLLIPYAARIQDVHGRSSSKKLSAIMTLVVLVVAVGYWAVILPFQRPMFHLLYSDRYLEVLHLLPIVAIGSVIWTVAYGPAIALRAMNAPESVFVAFGSATAISLLVGIPATWWFGVEGAIWGSNTADILSLILVLYVLKRNIAEQSGSVVGRKWWRKSQTLPAEASAD